MKRKHLIFIAGIFLILSIGIGLTYSYFVPAFIGTSGEDLLNLYKYNLKVNYINTSSVLINSTTSTVVKNMTIENKNAASKNYLLVFDNVVNTIPGGATLTYSFTCSSTISTCASKSSTAAPTTNGEFSTVRAIAAGAVHTYEITFILTGTITTETFSTNINAKLINYMDARGGYSGTPGFWTKYSVLTGITFESTIDIPAGTLAANIWDMSVANDSSIMAYYDTVTRIVHVQSNGPITASANGAGMFANMGALLAITNPHLLDTSQVTSMYQMFRDSTKVANLDLSGWNTSKVTTMYQMFNEADLLVTLNISTWNVSNVTSMQSMFYGAQSIKTIYWNSAIFKTSGLDSSMMFIGIPSSSTNKGNIYVYNQAAYDLLYQRLIDATGSRHLNNIITIDPTCSYCP